jgi:hypothetical protein
MEVSCLYTTGFLIYCESVLSFYCKWFYFVVNWIVSFWCWQCLMCWNSNFFTLLNFLFFPTKHIYLFFVYVAIHFFHCGSSYIVIDFDEVPTKLESKVVDVSNDTLCLHGIVSSNVDDACPKCWFPYIHEKELQNVNKRRQRASRHAKMWTINAFDRWREFCGFNVKNPCWRFDKKMKRLLQNWWTCCPCSFFKFWRRTTTCTPTMYESLNAIL